jgi:hypothetical protein
MPPPDASRAIAFIDWDLAAPGLRIHDLADYGPAELTALVPTALWWQSRAADGIDAQAEAGTRRCDVSRTSAYRRISARSTTGSRPTPPSCSKLQPDSATRRLPRIFRRNHHLGPQSAWAATVSMNGPGPPRVANHWRIAWSRAMR